MKLKANTYYRTRNGKKAFVAVVCTFGVITSRPALGWIFSVGEWRETSWTADGSSYTDGNLSQNDLAAEWVEPSPPEEFVIDGRLYRLVEKEGE